MSPKQTHLSIRTRLIVSIATCTLAGLSGLAAAAHSWRANARINKSFPAIAKTGPAPSVPERRRPIAEFESELVTLTPHGFEPREITRPQGRFLLMVDNLSGLATSNLQLNRKVGGRLREFVMRREDANWSDVIDLPPGRYVLSDADHPEWTCQVTITAK